MKGRNVGTLVLLFCLSWVGTALGATCPGTVVSLNLTSPSSSGHLFHSTSFSGNRILVRRGQHNRLCGLYQSMV